ncbi:MAG TPA: substrate-binding domain-containing protein [Solirubrobacteraceae bacterium]|nr:substrate-binding domain-containing protein [Solirubrobacteraceae bacterium]
MRRTVRVYVLLLGALLGAVALAACGNAKSGSGGGSSSGSPGGASSSSASSGGHSAKGAKVAFLMPDEASPRYVLYDHPSFVKRMKHLCPSCQVLYADANGDQNAQQQEMQSDIAQGAKVIVVDPVNASAIASTVNQAMAQGIKVISYDRPFNNLHTSFYVSFNNVTIGRDIARSEIAHLRATGQLHTGGILIVNGSPTDPAAGLIKQGIHEGIAGSGVKVLAEYSTPDWTPSDAQNWVAGQISRFHSQIKGVIAANDGTGGAAVAAFKAANVHPIPPVTGNDATTAGVQLIIAGEQYNTINKPYHIEADAAANAAYDFLTGKTPPSHTKVFGTPAQLFTPHVVTRANIKSQLIDPGFQTVKELCTKTYAADCKKLGL